MQSEPEHAAWGCTTHSQTLTTFPPSILATPLTLSVPFANSRANTYMIIRIRNLNIWDQGASFFRGGVILTVGESEKVPAFGVTFRCTEMTEWNLSHFLSPCTGCLRPLASTNGYVNISEFQISFPVGTVISYRCFPGFKLDGSAYLECLHNLIWSSSPPRCLALEGNTSYSFQSCILYY